MLLFFGDHYASFTFCPQSRVGASFIPAGFDSQELISVSCGGCPDFDNNSLVASSSQSAAVPDAQQSEVLLVVVTAVVVNVKFSCLFLRSVNQS